MVLSQKMTDKSSYKPVMTIISLRRKPPKTCFQKCLSLFTIRNCGMLVIMTAFVVAAVGIELQLQHALSVDLKTVHEQGSDWCGDWTPFGNLGNESYDPVYSESVDPAIPSCSKSKVGTPYSGKPSLFYCSPDLTAYNRSSAYLALDMRFENSMRSNYTIISHSRSLSHLLMETTPMLCRNTVGTWEAVFVLDASFDDSLQVLHHILTSPICLQSALVRARVYVQPLAGMLETSSLNLAMGAAKPSHFYIYVPPNVQILELGWNRQLARPALEFNDIFSVSGQCGSNLERARDDADYSVGRCTAESQLDIAAAGEEEDAMDTENSVFMTETNTRGPVLWRADALRELGFLNEANYFQNDNDELNRRAYLMRGWYSAYKYVSSYVIESPISFMDEPEQEDGWLERHIWRYFRKDKSRNDHDLTMSSPSTFHLPEHAQHALSDYRRFRSKQTKSTCGTAADDTSAYFHPFHASPEKRELTMDYDISNPQLPPLTPMI